MWLENEEVRGPALLLAISSITCHFVVGNMQKPLGSLREHQGLPHISILDNFKLQFEACKLDFNYVTGDSLASQP